MQFIHKNVYLSAISRVCKLLHPEWWSKRPLQRNKNEFLADLVTI